MPKLNSSQPPSKTNSSASGAVFGGTVGKKKGGKGRLKRLSFGSVGLVGLTSLMWVVLGQGEVRG